MRKGFLSGPAKKEPDRPQERRERPTVVVGAHGLSMLDPLVVPPNVNIITFTNVGVNQRDNVKLLRLIHLLARRPPLQLFTQNNAGRTLTKEGKDMEEDLAKSIPHTKIRNHLPGDVMANAALEFDPKKLHPSTFGIFNATTGVHDQDMVHAKEGTDLRELLSRYPNGGTFFYSSVGPSAS